MNRIPAVVLALVLVGPAGAQTLASKGTPSTFEVATWNIGWFGSTSRGPSDEMLQLQNVARVMRESEIDLWAVQEIDDEGHFRSLIDELGEGWRGELSTTGSNFKLGYVYRTDVVFVIQKGAYLSRFSHEFADRPPLMIEANVRLPADTVRTILINLHMKAFGDPESFERRGDAASRLKAHIEFDFEHRPVIVLGDFNDRLTASITPARPSPYQAFVADADRYAFLTFPLDEQNVPTWCGSSGCTSGSTFDHILITDELFDAYMEGSAARYGEVLEAIEGYTSTTSDHLPVFARFRFSSSTAVEMRPTVRSALRVYPNPLSASSRVEYTTAGSGPAALALYDVTGRIVYRREAPFRGPGTHAFRLDGTGLSAGVYLAVVAHPGGVSTARVLVVP